MKTTDNQKEIIDRIINHLQYLKINNDINSFTHYNLIDELENEFEEIVRKPKALTNAITIIYDSVKNNP